MANEIVKKEQGYIVSGDMSQLLSEEMDGLQVNFPRIKIPSGGGLAYEVPGDDPDSPDAVKEFKAVIAYNHNVNQFYREKYTGESVPPDCSSNDGKTGIDAGTGETIECKSCPLNQNGSGEGGVGKACTNKRRLYLIREGDLIPTVLTLPPTSRKAISNYITSLVNRHRRASGVVTKFSLKKAQSKGGITYSEAVLSLDRVLSDEEQAAMQEMSKSIRAYADNAEYGD